VFDQSQAINIYDKNGYMLKVNLFHSKCSDYQNPKTLKAKMATDPSFYKDCAAILGPNQPSITTPDPTATGHQFNPTQGGPPKPPSKPGPTPTPPPLPKLPVGNNSAPNAKDKVDGITKTLNKDQLRKKAIQKLKDAIREGGTNVQKLRKRLQDKLGIKLPPISDLPKPPPNQQAPVPTFPTPGGGGGTTPSAPSVPNVPDTTGPLLDYLFAP
jgi:hypothetical protein